MGEKRPTNSELNLRRLEEEEARRTGAEPRGIYEIFPRDEDAPLHRDPDGDDTLSRRPQRGRV